MPQAPPRPCRCGRLHCQAHPHTKGWAAKPAQPRIRGSKLIRLRQDLFASEPFCRPCKAQGRIRLATIRDHVINLAEGGTDTEDNVQPVCGACHKAKTSAEALRGRGL